MHDYLSLFFTLPRKLFHIKCNINIFPLFSHVFSSFFMWLLVYSFIKSLACDSEISEKRQDWWSRKETRRGNSQNTVFISHSATPLFHQQAFGFVPVFSATRRSFSTLVGTRNWEDFHVFRSVSNVQSSMQWMTPECLKFPLV